MARLGFTEAETQFRIDTLLRADDFGRQHWTSFQSASDSLTFKFEIAPAADYDVSNVQGFAPFVEAEKAAIRSALSEFDKFLNISFVEDNATPDADISFYKASDLDAANPATTGAGGLGGWSYIGNEWDGIAIFNQAEDLANTFNRVLLLHEIGHTLGLKHSGNYDVAGGETVGPFLPPSEESQRWTVMSYNPDPTSPVPPDRLKFYDIMALQEWWGEDFGQQRSAVEVQRFFNPQTGAHFYTASKSERDQVLAYQEAYVFEGNAFDLNVSPEAGTAVYRFYNPQAGTHFYTSSETERDITIRDLPNMNFEGVAYYAHMTDAAGRAELHRFYNTQTGTHFYTSDVVERDSIAQTLPQYTYEGVAYYVDIA